MASSACSAWTKPPSSLDAWELVMRALSHYGHVSPRDHLTAQALLRKAIEIDPNFGCANDKADSGSVPAAARG